MKHIIALLTALLLTASALSAQGKEQQATTIHDKTVTPAELVTICQQLDVPTDLKQWVRVKMYFDKERMLNQWIYIKGKDADYLLVLTKHKGKEEMHLNVQKRQRKGDSK